MNKADQIGGLGRARQTERGYALLSLLFAVTLLAVGAAAVAPSIAFQIRRDQEEELIHRGVQYARAVRRFSKQTGRFPSRFEELHDGSVGQRYLRRLYKDPLTGGDFQPVYTSDIAAAAATVKLNGSSSDEQEKGSSDDGTFSPGSNPRASGHETHGPGEIIFGVVSTSKARTIREFNHKNHYNQWLFFYDPNYDRGLEIKGPTSLIPAASLPAQPNAASGKLPAQTMPQVPGQTTSQVPGETVPQPPTQTMPQPPPQL